jgi:type IV pilus assembly protein PilB
MNAVSTANLMGITGIARRLVLDGAMDEAAARKAMDDATAEKTPLASYIAERKLVPPAALAAAYSMEFGMPTVDPLAIDPAQSAVSLVKEELLRKHQALPLFRRGGRLFVGLADPTNNRALEELKFHTNLAVEPILVDAERIRRCLDLWLEAAEALNDAEEEGMDNLEVSGGDEDFGSDSGVDAKGDDTPVVKFINKALVDAIRKGASDIHFEPYETDYRVRYRIDGILKTVRRVPVKLHSRIAARLKVMSQLDIAEKRVPQDGRIKLNLSKSKQIDFRVSTLPTLFGEKVVLRILDGSAAKLGIEKLGYEPDQQQALLFAVGRPYGMILVTGPTGSGKTVSLYTCLSILNQPGVNIATAEDPAEIQLPGVNQVNVNEKAGLTFATALRAFLRQDPDVIMVGEIRDLETADISIKAAQTGHLVLSTLHTNDAPSTLVRMLNMGVAPFNIASSVNIITAQRLARKLCTHCRRPEDIPPEALLRAGFLDEDLDGSWQPFGPVGCDHCKGTGYKGRIGVYEVMPITDEMKQLFMRNGNSLDIAEQAQREGVRNLRQSGLLKVKSGMTSLEEIEAVTNE